MVWTGKKGRTRSRDGWGLNSSSKRRSIREHGGLSARQHKRVTKMNRAYKKGQKSYRGKQF